jgi:hypothetical protein
MLWISLTKKMMGIPGRQAPCDSTRLTTSCYAELACPGACRECISVAEADGKQIKK